MGFACNFSLQPTNWMIYPATIESFWSFTAGAWNLGRDPLWCAARECGLRRTHRHSRNWVEFGPSLVPVWAEALFLSQLCTKIMAGWSRLWLWLWLSWFIMAVVQPTIRQIRWEDFGSWLTLSNWWFCNGPEARKEVENELPRWFSDWRIVTSGVLSVNIYSWL